MALWGKHFLAIFMFIVAFAAPSYGQSLMGFKINKALSIKNPYTLVAPKWLKTRPVYMDIINQSHKDDALIGASSPFAQEVVLQYTHTYGQNVQTMRPLPNQELVLPAQSVVKLRPSGMHLMLKGLKQPLSLGMEAPIKLVFKHTPPLYIKALIQQQPD